MGKYIAFITEKVNNEVSYAPIASGDDLNVLETELKAYVKKNPDFDITTISILEELKIKPTMSLEVTLCNNTTETVILTES